MKILFVLGLLFSAQISYAEVVVIVNSANTSAVNMDDVSRIFLGKKSSFSDGANASPYYLPAGDSVREAFDEKALGKTSSQLKAYWSKLVFTGKGSPPPEVSSAQDAVNKVATDPSAIAYVDRSAVTDAVKIVLTVP